MKPLVQNPGAIPRLAMINDITGFGRCSIAVALPVISVMQVQVCVVPTSILSNHLGFPTYYFDDYTSRMPDYLRALADLEISFDAVACGFLGNVEQISIVEAFLKEAGNTSLFLLDPVMGDHGRTYSTIMPEHCSRLLQLVKYADILTPNITEACLLTGTPYKAEGWIDPELETLCRTLENGTGKKIVITGLYRSGIFRNYIWENGMGCHYDVPAAGVSRPGTGDLFASILAADALNGVPFADSVKKAADFVALCIRGTEEAGVPLQEGVLFEKYLYHLIQ